MIIKNVVDFLLSSRNISHSRCRFWMTRMFGADSGLLITNQLQEWSPLSVLCQWDSTRVLLFLLRLEPNSVQFVRLHSASLRIQLHRDSPSDHSRQLQDSEDLLLWSTLQRGRATSRIQALPSYPEAAMTIPAPDNCLLSSLINFQLNFISLISVKLFTLFHSPSTAHLPLHQAFSLHPLLNLIALHLSHPLPPPYLIPGYYSRLLFNY